MGRSTATPNHQCISSNDVQGTEIYGTDGTHIGEIDHLIIDKVSGQVAYAVMSLVALWEWDTVTIPFLGPLFATTPNSRAFERTSPNSR